MQTNFYGYTQNDPVNFIDENGLWSISFDFYLGGGGGVTIGQNDKTGEWFGGGRLGFGVGGGANFDILNNGPTDRKLRPTPNSEPCDSLKAGSSGTSAGTFVGIGASLGPYGINYGAQAGKHFDGTDASYRDEPGFNLGLNAFGGSGFSVGGALGFEVLGW